MTGYGKAEIHFNGKKIHAEIKSLNSKNLDLSARIAPIYREKEMEVRKFIAAQLERGKVDFNLSVEKDQASSFQSTKKQSKTTPARFAPFLKATTFLFQNKAFGKYS